jgi:hypothetical protein
LPFKFYHLFVCLFFQSAAPPGGGGGDNGDKQA